jgi:Regulator of ribonuclease activity B
MRRLAGVFGRDAGFPRVERIADPADADQRVLAHLRVLGCDPKQPRGVRHFIYLAGAADAAAVASTLEREGWETSVHEGDNVWLVVAACLRVLTQQMVQETRCRLESLAALHDGHYDGWEAEVT